MDGGFYSSEGDALLRQAGLRITRPRQAIARVMVEARDHPNAEQVLARARQREPGVSQATAYRTLAALAARGLLRTHTFDGGVMRYELAEGPRHDHLIDIDSCEVREFASPEIGRLQARIAAEQGYEIVATRLELYCRKAG
jgi:Fur family ferric uptake transcriptional regulator